MAFKQDIASPQPSVQPVSVGADSSSALRFGALENIVKTAGSAVSNLASTARKQEADSVMADSIVGLTELQDQRLDALEKESSVTNEIALFHADGIITDDEKSRLDELQEDINFLDDARKTGVLSRKGFSTRFNALMKDSLSRAENLGIQTPIAQLFLQQRSVINAPQQLTAEQQAVATTMDAMHGKGNWSVQQAGEFVGKQRWAAGILQSGDTNPGNLQRAYENTIETAITALQTDAKSGATITELEISNFAQQLQNQTLGVIEHLNRKEAELAKAGPATAAARKQLSAARKSILETRDYYAEKMWGSKSMERFGAEKSLERANKMRKLLAEYNIPPELLTLQALAGGDGKMGFAGPDAMLSLLDPSNTAADFIFEERAAQMGGVVTAQQLKQNLATRLVAAMQQGVSNEEMVDRGLVTPQENRMFTIKFMSQAVNSPEESKAQIEAAGSLKPVAGNALENIDNLGTFGGKFDDLLANARRNGTETDLKARTTDLLRRHALELTSAAAEGTNFDITMTEDGRLALSPREGADFRGGANVGISGGQRRARLQEQLEVFDAVVGKVLGSGVLTQGEVADFFTPAQTETAETQAPEAQAPEEADASVGVNIPGITQAVADEPRTKDTSVDFEFIGELEGAGIAKGYIPQSNGQVLGQSGVTIGTGVDLGQWTEAALKKAGVSKELIAKVSPFLGAKKQKALDLLNDNPLELTPEEVSELDSSVKSHLLKGFTPKFNKESNVDFDQLNPDIQTVIASVMYQYGTNLKKRTPKFWGMITEGRWEDAVAELRNFGDDFSTRRNKEADLLEAVLQSGDQLVSEGQPFITQREAVRQSPNITSAVLERGTISGDRLTAEEERRTALELGGVRQNLPVAPINQAADVENLFDAPVSIEDRVRELKKDFPDASFNEIKEFLENRGS